MIFEPKNCSEETTGPIWMKLGINNLFSKTRNIIEEFFDIPPPRGWPHRGKNDKNFILFFQFFWFQGLPEDDSSSLNNFLVMKIGNSFELVIKMATYIWGKRIKGNDWWPI